MPDQTEIANRALSRIGAARIISFASATTTEGRAVQSAYDMVRDEVLSEYPWNRCTKYASLPADAVIPAAEWDLQYPLPGDFLRVTEVDPPQTSSDFPEWTEGAHQDTGIPVLLCDLESPLVIRYIFRQAEGFWSAGLAMAVAARLSIEIFADVTGGVATKRQALWEEYRSEILPRAMQADGLSQSGALLAEDPWVNVASGRGSRDGSTTSS